MRDGRQVVSIIGYIRDLNSFDPSLFEGSVVTLTQVRDQKVSTFPEAQDRIQQQYHLTVSLFS